MTEKKQTPEPKGPGDPCPSCGAELGEPRSVTAKGKDEPQPEGAARCPSCGYVLSAPKEGAEPSSSRR